MGVSFISPAAISAYVIHRHARGGDYLLLRRCSMKHAWENYTRNLSEEEKASIEPRFQRRVKEVGFLQETWQMVSGGIHDGERAYETARREIFEETGLTPNQLYTADAVETFYMKSIDRVMFVPVFVAYIDQLQPIRLSPHEHDAYEWLPYEKALERLVFSEQKRVIAHVHQNFVLRTPLEIHRID